MKSLIYLPSVTEYPFVTDLSTLIPSLLKLLNGKAVGLSLGTNVPFGNPDSALEALIQLPIQLLVSLNGDSEIGVEPLLSFWVYILVV